MNMEEQRTGVGRDDGLRDDLHSLDEPHKSYVTMLIKTKATGNPVQTNCLDMHYKKRDTKNQLCR